jgi:dynein light chain 1
MPTTIKAALKKWEEASGKKSSEAKEIKLIGVYPPIEKLEGPLHILVNCEKLSLSTNLITQIQNLQVLKNLKVLSLGRNLIKSLQETGFPKFCKRIGMQFKKQRAQKLKVNPLPYGI